MLSSLAQAEVGREGWYPPQPSLVCRELHYGRNSGLLALTKVQTLAQLALAMTAKAHHVTLA